VGLIARLVPEKGIDDAIAALRLLGGEAPFLAVWGAGPLERRLLEALRRGELRGSFGGFLSLADVPRALRACDVILIPSRSTETSSEQFGRIALEAQLSGSTVIAYRSGELPFVVGEGGLLVEEGNEQELAKAIHELATNNELRTRLARLGQEQALRRFHPTAQAHRLIGLWTKMAGG
jgi:glycosyltransferase involved in cell wall biosynthesis